MNKPSERRNKISFINARNEITEERAFSFLREHHIQKIVAAYRDYESVEGFAKIVDIDEVAQKQYSLNIPLYVLVHRKQYTIMDKSLPETIADWEQSSHDLRDSMGQLLDMLRETGLDTLG